MALISGGGGGGSSPGIVTLSAGVAITAAQVAAAWVGGNQDAIVKIANLATGATILGVGMVTTAGWNGPDTVDATLDAATGATDNTVSSFGPSWALPLSPDISDANATYTGLIFTGVGPVSAPLSGAAVPIAKAGRAVYALFYGGVGTAPTQGAVTFVLLLATAT